VWGWVGVLGGGGEGEIFVFEGVGSVL